MLDEHRGRNRAPVQDVERHLDDLGRRTFSGKYANRSDQACPRLTELGAPFRRRVLAHDGRTSRCGPLPENARSAPSALGSLIAPTSDRRDLL